MRPLRDVTFTPSRRLGAALAASGLASVAVVAVAISWAALSAASEERDAKADLLERSVAASRRVALVGQGPAAADPFVSAPTVTLAAARVDADVRALASACGLSLKSSRADAKPDEPDGGGGPGTRIEDEAIVEGTNEALWALLSKLDGATPVTLVDSLSIEPAEQDQAAPGDPRSPTLRMTLTLSAYWRGEAAASAPR